MKQNTLSFYECEHHEDVNAIIKDIESCNGVIIEYHLDTEEETVCITFNCDVSFMLFFKATESFKYIN